MQQITENVGLNVKIYSHFNDPEVYPKRAVVLDALKHSDLLGIKKGEEFVFRGKGYVDHRLSNQRTFFIPKPAIIAGNNYYFEVKGYGMSGKELYFQKHCEGDLFYGMFLEEARREYAFMKLAMDVENVSRPVALLEFPRTEFIKQGFLGLEQRLVASLRFRQFDISSLAGFVDKKLAEAFEKGGRNFDSTCNAISKKLVDKLKTAYLSAGERALIEKFDELGFEDCDDPIEGLRDKKPAGYLIRMAKSPFRAALEDDVDDKIIIKAGKAYGKLLEKKILHLVPSLGNITTAGELTDFEDCMFFNETERLKQSFDFFKEREPIRNIQEYIAMTLSKRYLGEKHPLFIESAFGKQMSPQEAAGVIMRISGLS
ncbi:hypothetical protein KY308_04375 [Candidatus Woesearchaeota archaeon]|nr:hypothetical protein [Candidatus Woesearchaeota archaeon]